MNEKKLDDKPDCALFEQLFASAFDLIIRKVAIFIEH